jgi:hypothetical protein
MKIDAGSRASFASIAALAVSAFLVWAALTASFAAAAASSFDFASALAESSCVPASVALVAAFCFRSSARALVRPGGSEHLVGGGEFGVGAGLEPLQFAQRRRQRRRLARRTRYGFPGFVGCLGGLLGLAGERLGPGRRGRDGLRLRHEQRRMGELDRLGVIRRDDHAHPDPRLVEQLLGKAKGHPHAAVRGRISG